jgi:hypothetical protein
MADSLALDLGADAREVIDLAEARELVHTSFQLMDAGRRPEVADFFVPDGVHRLGDDTARGREAIRATLAARNDPSRRTAHAITTQTVRAVGSDAVSVTSLVVVYDLAGSDPTIPQAVTSVEDDLVRTDGGWRFSSRRIRVLSLRA